MTAVRPADFAQPGTRVLARIPQHDATQLTRGGNQALIILDDQIYQLRITRAGKLILTGIEFRDETHLNTIARRMAESGEIVLGGAGGEAMI